MPSSNQVTPRFTPVDRRDPANSAEDRWRRFSIEEVRARDYKIDSLKWLRDESLDDADELPEPEELATDAIAELEGAVDELNGILALLENGASSDARVPVDAAS